MKTQIRICLTVEFKANFLISGLLMALLVMAIGQTRLPGRRSDREPTTLDDGDKGKFREARG
jgi:hypothetical protein